MNRILDQLSRARWVILYLLIPGIGLLGIVVVMRVFLKIPIVDFVDDTLTLAKLPPYMGMISNLGILAWCATASICLLSSILIKDQKPRHSAYLRATGLLSAYLLLDDQFLLHEVVFGDYLHIPQIVTIALIGLALIWILFAYRAEILQTDYLLLGGAILFLCFSIVFDQFLHSIPQVDLLEDGFKFLGILMWLGYFTHTSLQILKPTSSN